MTPWIIQWIIPSLLHQSRRKNLLVQITIFNNKVWITCLWWNTKSWDFRAAVNHWIVFTANHINFMLKTHLLWKVSMKSIFSNYPDAHVFVLRIRVPCALLMRCPHVRFKVRWKRESTRIKARQDHKYSYEMLSVSALTNLVTSLEKSILKCVDSVIGKSDLKF